MLSPRTTHTYHVFLASPGDVAVERQHVRKFFDEYNRHTAHIWNARFDVVDCENYSTIGIGRPQELITQQTLAKHRDSLALVIGIMGQRFGSPSGKAESGTEEEFNWAMERHAASGFPEIKWFFRKVDKLEMPADPAQLVSAVEQWQKVLAFRQRMQDLSNPVFYVEYPSPAAFAEVLARDLNHWLADPSRPWAAELAAHIATTGGMSTPALPAEFDAESYRTAVLKRFDKFNFEMLDTTGAFYSEVRLCSVFVEQSVRECHQYNPRLLEIPKEHQRLFLGTGEIIAKELPEVERQADRLRQEYFHQPLRPVLEVVDEAFRASAARMARKLVILGDPGSGKSSLVRYLAVRWADITESAVRDKLPIPLVVELATYGRWLCDRRKDFILFLEEAPGWHQWSPGLLRKLIAQPGRSVLLLDGLDEVFDAQLRANIMDDIQRFSSQFPHLSILVTSRIVGYQTQRLRNAEFRHFMLQDLEATQIADFVQRWHEVTFDVPAKATPKRDRLQKAIRESRAITLLAGNPLLLTMMAILNRNQELPRDRADLYTQVSRLLLHQWDTERTLAEFPGISADIGLREKTDLLRLIAAHMQVAPGGLKGNQIDGSTLTSLIEGYLQDELHITQSRAVARAVVEQLRLRNFILCSVGTDSYAFIHRTFLEYFCAADFVHRFNVAKTLDVDGLISLFDQHCRDDDWREVLRLICGQIDEGFVGRIVERLATRTELKTSDPNISLLELPLAIWCLSEVRNPAKLEKAGSLLMQQCLALLEWSIFELDFWFDAVLPAARDLGERWPGKEEVYEFKHSGPDAMRGYGEHPWVSLIAVVDSDRERMTALADSQSPFVRASAVWFLAEKWPDSTTRDLLTQDVVQGGGIYSRCAALEALAEKWADRTTRDLLVQRAVQDAHHNVRCVALMALAEKWADRTTRDLLVQRAVQDDYPNVRCVALMALAEKWADRTTRDLLVQRAVQDDYPEVCCVALKALAEKWADRTTRDLLVQRAVQDDYPEVCCVALEVLAKKWPDQTTRDLLTQHVIQGGDIVCHLVALDVLVEKWPDPTTRALVTRHVVQGDHPKLRCAALRRLVKKWADRTTRDLLVQRAVQDDEHGVRRVALDALVGNWADRTIRDFLAQRATQDDHLEVRLGALDALTGKWADRTTRDLLIQRAVEDDHPEVRLSALKALAENWADQTTHDFLAQRAVEDDHPEVRLAALDALAGKWADRTTRDLLIQRAVEDDHPEVRLSALKALAENWADQTTHDFLAQRAVEDDHPEVRLAALDALTGKWADRTNRDLLIQRAVEDDHPEVRLSALKALAENWADQTTHDFLAQRAVEDDHPEVRLSVLKALAENWADQTAHDFLAQRAVEDDHPEVRLSVLKALAENWADQITRDLFVQRAVQDDHPEVRLEALNALAEKWPDQITLDLLAQCEK
nr:HEAT repeat domain-containing protein [uncultured Desulfobulbus sp.]